MISQVNLKLMITVKISTRLTYCIRGTFISETCLDNWLTE